MSKIEKILSILGVCTLVATTACSATANSDADGMADGMVMPDTTSGQDTTTAAKTFKSIVIWDKSEDPAFRNGKCGSSPGSDIDAVMLYRGGHLIAAGKVGSASYDTSKATSCDNKKNIASNAEGAVNAHVYASSPDTGYISLNGGSIELQFGACSTATEDVTKCDGAGAEVDVMTGDQIDFYEVDSSYKPGSGTAMDGFAYDGCVCYSDQYQVDLRTAVGVDAGSVVLQSGSPSGGDTFTGTEAWPVNKYTATVK